MTIYSLDVLLSQFWTSPVFHVRTNCCPWPSYKFLTRQVRWSGIPISLRVFDSLLWSTQSKALVYSMNQQQLFSWNSLAFSMIQQMLAIWSLVPLSLRTSAFTLLQWKHRPSRSLKNAFCCFAGRVKDRNYMFSWLQVWSYEEKMAK